MSKVVNSNTGEIRNKIRTWRDLQAIEDYAKPGMESNLVQHHDFTFDLDSRELRVVKTELEDRDAYIQSFADECGVYNILAKFALTGDASLLNKKPGIYADLSNLPEDDLNPGAAQLVAQDSVEKLNALLGTHFTQEELASMSPEAIEKLIDGYVASHSPSTEEKKESE